MSNLHPAVSRLSAAARREFENAIHPDRHGANLAEAGARSRTTVQLPERIIIALGSAHPPLRCAARWTSSSSSASETGAAAPSWRQNPEGAGHWRAFGERRTYGGAERAAITRGSRGLDPVRHVPAA